MIDFQNSTQIQNNQSLTDKVENEEMKNFLSSLSEGIGLIESQPDPDLFQYDNDVQTKTTITTKYCNTKAKTRNLLTSVSYRRYKPEDVKKNKLCYQCFLIFNTNLNPTGRDRKLKPPL